MMQTIMPESVLLGSLVGIVLAFTGAGGAIIAVPLLIFGLHLAMIDAAPIALFAVSVSAAIGALLSLKRRKVRYHAACFLALTGLAASPLGVFVAQRIPNAPLTLLFAVVLAYAAFNTFRQSMRTSQEDPATSSAPCRLGADGRLIWTWPCTRLMSIAGASAGFLSGLLGVGSGFIFVPVLQKITDLHMQSIMPTSLAVIALVSGTGVISAMVMRGMDWAIAIPFALGAVAAMLLISAFANRFTGPRLQQGFAILAGCTAIGMLVSQVQNLQ
jgi:uncharacterized membrane protein YfcA